MGLIEILNENDAAHTVALGVPRREFRISAIVEAAAYDWVAVYRAEGGLDGNEAVQSFWDAVFDRRSDIVRAYADCGVQAEGWTDEALTIMSDAAVNYDATGLAGDEAIIGLLSPALDDLAQEVTT